MLLSKNKKKNPINLKNNTNVYLYVYMHTYIQNRNRFIDITTSDYQRGEGSEEG